MPFAHRLIPCQKIISPLKAIQAPFSRKRRYWIICCGIQTVPYIVQLDIIPHMGLCLVDGTLKSSLYQDTLDAQPIQRCLHGPGIAFTQTLSLDPGAVCRPDVPCIFCLTGIFHPVRRVLDQFIMNIGNFLLLRVFSLFGRKAVGSRRKLLNSGFIFGNGRFHFRLAIKSFYKVMITSARPQISAVL